MKPKVLLINSPIRLDARPNCIPYGLATIASLLRQHGFPVQIYDINAERDSAKTIINKLKYKYEWDIVGVSGLVTTLKFQKSLIRVLNIINPNGHIVVGGGAEKYISTSPYGNPYSVWATVSGEGEKTFLRLCNAKLDFGDYTVEQIKNIDCLPHPAWDLLPMWIYLKNPIWGDVANNSSGFNKGVKVTRSMNILTSRGCPHNCNFCYHQFKGFRQRSVESVLWEIDLLVDRYGIDFLGAVDDNMMVNEKWITQFCEELLFRDYDLKWGCHGRVDKAKPEILKLMKEAGCVWIGYGIESGSQKILDAMNKGFTVEQAAKAITDTRAVGIYPNTTLIYGYPGETPETVVETVIFKKRLGIKAGSFYVTPYPGTKLWEQVKHKIPDEEDFVLRLGNATQYVENFTEMPDEYFHNYKKVYDGEV